MTTRDSGVAAALRTEFGSPLDRVVSDVIWALRNQPSVSREDAAVVLERDVLPPVLAALADAEQSDAPSEGGTGECICTPTVDGGHRWACPKAREQPARSADAHQGGTGE